jgi:hypothetical protein
MIIMRISHKIKMVELGLDIRSLDQIAHYPIIICDVNGVAKAFDSDLEGAYPVSEIRTVYPNT